MPEGLKRKITSSWNYYKSFFYFLFIALFVFIASWFILGKPGLYSYGEASIFWILVLLIITPFASGIFFVLIKKLQEKLKLSDEKIIWVIIISSVIVGVTLGVLGR